jgi:O-acetyl-ADP-ribose deacetylase (regulator of RNase III)
MQKMIGSTTLELVQGDITRETTDAIVNAANEALRPGGGVDGAITRAAGQAALQARLALGHCPTGDAVIGPGGALAAAYIIYAVGPVYHNGLRGEAQLLASAYRRSLELCVAHDLDSVAFPAISTGIYGYPMREAAWTALATIIEFLKAEGKPRLVRVVLFDTNAYQIWAKCLQEDIE